MKYSFRTEMNLKLRLDMEVIEFKNIIQKLLYWVWNKYWAEELKRKEEFYYIKNLSFELSPEGLDLMSERHAKQKLREGIRGNHTRIDLDTSTITRKSYVSHWVMQIWEFVWYSFDKAHGCLISWHGSKALSSVPDKLTKALSLKTITGSS